MSGSVVDPPVVGSGRVGPSVRSSRWMVLAAVVIGLVTGSLACAAGLAEGHDHDSRAATTSVVEPAGHARASHGASGQDDGRHPPDSPIMQGHPGMACVVPVDLRFPEPTPVQVSVSCDGLVDPGTVGWAADIDPPVPRSS